jgi:hypothetical protein
MPIFDITLKQTDMNMTTIIPEDPIFDYTEWMEYISNELRKFK